MKRASHKLHNNDDGPKLTQRTGPRRHDVHNDEDAALLRALEREFWGDPGNDQPATAATKPIGPSTLTRAQALRIETIARAKRAAAMKSKWGSS